MKSHSLFLAALAALTFTSTPDTKAALTSNLVAYWDFEGQSNNNAAATGGGAYNGTLLGGATTAGTPRVGSGGLSLDGVDDYMNVPTIVPANGPWSVAAWFQSDIAPTGAGRSFVYESTGGANGFSMSFALRDGTTGAPVGTAAQTSLQVFSRYGGTNVNAQTLVDDTVIPATWHHTLTVFTPATATETGSIVNFINGTQSASIVLPVGAVLEPITGFRVGTYRNADGRWFDGSIDEVAIWDRTLTPAEAAEVYTLGTTNQAIPEPSALLLAGLGALQLLRRRR